MIVVDASAVLEVILRTGVSANVADRLFAAGESLHAPHLIDVEVAQVIRRYVAGKSMGARRGREAIEDHVALPIERYRHDLLLPRVYELRRNMTAYDAVYVALAEVLNAPLVTRDAKLAKASGLRAKIESI
ncbi:MAG: type II toxin-antitoxin system VapC family toxin [Gemmatimonadales bacterium]